MAERQPPPDSARDALRALGSEVGWRVGAPVTATLPESSGVQDAVAACFAAGCEAEAIVAVAPLAARVLEDAARARELMRDDPAHPGLKDCYGRLLSELSFLATLHATGDAAHSATYGRLCAEIGALMSAASPVRPVWDLIYGQETPPSRVGPPPRRRPTTPLADDDEYYA